LKKTCRTLKLPSVDRTLQLFQCIWTPRVFRYHQYRLLFPVASYSSSNYSRRLRHVLSQIMHMGQSSQGTNFIPCLVLQSRSRDPCQKTNRIRTSPICHHHQIESSLKAPHNGPLQSAHSSVKLYLESLIWNRKLSSSSADVDSEPVEPMDCNTCCCEPTLLSL
jgi:hypothetical protein